MANGDLVSYRFMGRHPTVEDANLERALAALVDFWVRTKALVKNEMGNLRIQYTIENKLHTVEITDSRVLDDLRYQGPVAVLQHLAASTGLSPEHAMKLFENTPVFVEVDTIRVPHRQDHWRPDSGTEVDKVVPVLVKDQISVLASKPETRPMVLDIVGRSVIELKVSDRVMADRTGLSRSVVRDARERFKAGKPFDKRQKLTFNQVQELLKRSRELGSVAKAADELGIPRSTASDAVRREKLRGVEKKEVVKAPKTPKEKKASVSEAKQKLFSAVKKDKQGRSVSEIAREQGIAERTAREWAKQAGVVRNPRPKKEVKTSAPRPVPAAREEVLRLVATGLSASEAGRQVGVSERTARRWAQK